MTLDNLKISAITVMGVFTEVSEADEQREGISKTTYSEFRRK